MQKKSLETILYSAAGLVIMLVLVILLNFVVSFEPARIDLTQEKAYTLSKGTLNILKKIESPIEIHFYCSQAESATPETVYLKSYAKRVEDLLAEYKSAAGGKIIIKKFDPQPDSDAEDSAHLDGIDGEMVQLGEKFYLGLAVTSLDQKEAIPFLSPTRERQLEYDISRAVSRVMTTDKPAVGIMSPLPVFGSPNAAMMMRMGQQAQRPWILVNELKQDFSVKQVPMDTDKIEEGIRVLLVIHPREITDKALYAIDQFIMGGGKLIAFLDPLPMFDAREQNQMLGSIPNAGSNLEKLLKAWGLSLDVSKVVADLNYKLTLSGPNGQAQEAPAILSITSDGINKDDVLTSQIDNIWLPYAGTFVGTPVAGLKETVLLKSTKDSQLVDGFMAHMSGDNVLKEFKPSGTQYALAVRLTGKFKTAFPNGKPEDKKDDAAKEGDKDKKPEDKSNANSLKETKEDNAVLLVGDADMLYDNVCVRQIQTPFGAISQPLNGNLNFAQSAVEQMIGDNNLIGVRSRATLSRPFTRVKEMEARANVKYQSVLKSLQDSAAETQRKINELQQQKQDKEQRFILSPEQQNELAKLRKQEAESRKQTKQVQKEFRKEVVSLQTRVKWINTLAVPLAVAASGIVIASVKRKRTSAK